MLIVLKDEKSHPRDWNLADKRLHSSKQIMSIVVILESSSRSQCILGLSQGRDSNSSAPYMTSILLIWFLVHARAVAWTLLDTGN